MSRILLVEDEPGLVLTLTDRLHSEGYEVETAGDGPGGLELACTKRFDLIVLDVMLPGRNGFDVCRDLRQTGDTTPVLMLTARGEVVDKVLGLKIGADDYQTKPFEMIELLARIEALLRRTSVEPLPQQEAVQFGGVEVRFDEAIVYRDGEPVQLSAQMFKLLKHFVLNPGVVISRDDLLNEVWGHDAIPSTRTVDVHVAWLRQRIEKNPHRPEFLLTVHGLGYKFVTTEADTG
ncbi:MAG: response regulator transcription factor [Gammaproteobacteria bacterium]